MKHGFFVLSILGILWIWVPEKAWAECSKCKARAIELRKKLLESERKEHKSVSEFDASKTDWGSTKLSSQKTKQKKKAS